MFLFLIVFFFLFPFATLILKFIIGIIKGASHQVTNYQNNMQQDIRTDTIVSSMGGYKDQESRDKFNSQFVNNKISYYAWLAVTIILISLIVYFLLNK